MSNLRRFTLSDQLVEALRTDILAGRWPDPLPGCRKLGAVYGVSGPTIVAALTRLVELGTLRSGGPRRAFRLLPPGEAVAPPIIPRRGKSPKRIVVVGSRSLEDLDAWDRNLLHALNHELGPQGVTAQYVRLDFEDHRSAPRRWSVALAPHQPDLVVPLTPTPAFQAWLGKSGMNVASLGGQAKPGLPPIYGPNLINLALRARALLLEHGHRRAIFVAFHLGQESYRKLFRERFAESLGLTQAQLEAEGHLICEHLPQPADRRRRLGEILSSARPTALILSEWRDYLLAFSLAASLGIRVPDQLSLLVLSESPDLDCVVPRPAHLRIPHSLYVDLLLRRLRGIKVDPAEFARQCEEHWDLGGTLARPAA